MIYETRKYINILNKLQITPSQFLFCWLLYNKQWEELKAYFNGGNKFSVEEIDDLDDKGIIHNMARAGDKIIPAHILITELFNQEMIISPDDAWEELMDKYPPKVMVNSVAFASKGITLSDEKELKERYTQYIKGNLPLHRQILALIEKWKEKNNGYAQFKIDKFITSKYWKDLETERDNNAGTALY